MRVRDSGMAEEAVWEGFFDPASVLAALRLQADAGDVVEFGCGYGTFTLPAARITNGTVWALDIDPAMVARTRFRAQKEGLENVRTQQRDFITMGTGRPDERAGYAMLFNILHHECPQDLLAAAWRALGPGGIVGVIHWNYDATTPRGPDLSIRPRPEQCASWLRETGFIGPGGIIDLPPHHWGLAALRPRH